MYSVVFDEKIYQKIEKYISTYRSRYLELYDDTGLGYAEDIIKSQYITNADILTDAFVDSIYDVMHGREILGYSIANDMTRVTTISIGSRRLFITYVEDADNMTRSVVDMEIYRR